MLVLSRRRFLIVLFSFFLAQILPSATTSKWAFAKTQREVGRQDGTSIAKSTEPVQQETNRSNLSQQKDKQARITLLYHTDPDVRSKTILEMAEWGDPKLIDDLIRAYSVEDYQPVCNVYEEALPSLTGMKKIIGKSAWKNWFATEVQNGRLNIDYIPVDVNSLDLKERMRLQTLAFRLDAKYFKEMAEVLTKGGDSRAKFVDALRYMIANDHKNEVRQFLSGNWLRNQFQKRDIDISIFTYYLKGLANPGPIRDRIDAYIRAFLESEDPVVVVNALHLLAGKEGNDSFLTVSDVEEKIKQLLNSPDKNVAMQAKRAMQKVHPGWGISYEEAFIDLYQTIGRQYPSFELKGIDWEAVGNAFTPRVKAVTNDEKFGLLCMELMAQLKDSHAYLLDGSAKVPDVLFPYWDPGFVCLEDDQGRPVVYHVIYGSPAWKAGIEIGMVVLRINDENAKDVIERVMDQREKYIGYSSARYLRYHGYRFFQRQMKEGATVKLDVLDCKDKLCHFELLATLRIPYQPRLPVPKDGINDSADVSWKRLDDQIGYIYVRRIKNNLIELLDEAVGELRNATGLVVDVRGNSGGGFDSERSHINFSLDNESVEPERPRFKGPIALLIDSRCISAGEGWASWFIAHRRARVFGEATAGASARKVQYMLKNGLYYANFPVKAYKGYLDRPIEYLGLEPDVSVVQNRKDLIRKRDTALELAREYLLQETQ